jgi:hypothetical protein
MSIQNVFTNGVLVDIHIRAWTGEKQLTPTDLGIPADKLPKAFKLGKKSLVPPEVIARFRNLDYLARKLLTDSSYPFPFGSARFVPKMAYVEFDDAFNNLKKKYELELESLLNNYTKYQYEMRTQFIAAAKTAYRRLSELKGYDGLDKKDDEGNPVYIMEIVDLGELKDKKGNTVYETKVIDGREVSVPARLIDEIKVPEKLTEYEFVNAFIDRIDKCYPSIEQLRKKYDMVYYPFQMELPDLSQASIDDVASECTKASLIQKGYQAKMVKELQGYATKIVEENRARAQKVIDTLANNIAQGKKFSNTTMKMVLKMINDFLKLNITNDETMEKELSNFRDTYLCNNSAKQIHESNEIQNAMLKDLKKLQELVRDNEAISALADAYRQKINL